MPHVTVRITPQGPLLSVGIGVSFPRHDALTRAGVPVPSPVTANLLVDTGASQTAVCTTVLAKLNLTPTGTISVLTPSTGSTAHQANLYDVALLVLSTTGSSIAHLTRALPVMDADFTAQGIHGLIGRDILAETHLTYSGPDNLVILSF